VSDFDANERLNQLKQRFIERSRQDLVAIRAARDPAELRPVVHRLSGAAGTFGYSHLSRLAGEVDDVLVEGGAPSEAEMARLIAEIERTVSPQG
jgi:HPt (histidine-containing phosphotransfer) domain-containing protein